MAKLENYNGSVLLMSGITQYGHDGALVEANAVQTKEDGTRLDQELKEIHELLNNGGTSGDNIAPDKILIWQPNTKYYTGDYVLSSHQMFGNNISICCIYSCSEEHTSGDNFSDDYDSVKWDMVKVISAFNTLEDARGNVIHEHYATKQDLADAVIGESNIIVDQSYNSESTNAQSGTAVAEALQNTENKTNKVTVIDKKSDDEHYPTALAVKKYADGLKPYTITAQVSEDEESWQISDCDTKFTAITDILAQGRDVVLCILNNYLRAGYYATLVMKNGAEYVFELTEDGCIYRFTVDGVDTWRTEIIKLDNSENNLAIVTPEMYGAKGDGTADDTDAIIAAMETKKPVHFRSNGTYRIRGIALDDGAEFHGNGCTILFTGYTAPSGDVCFGIVGKHDVIIDGFCLIPENHVVADIFIADSSSVQVKNCDLQGNSILDDKYCTDGANQCISIRRSEYITVENCRLRNVYSQALPISESSSHITVSGCRFENTGRGGVYVMGGNTDVDICDNIFINCVKYFNVADGAIDVYGDPLETGGLLNDTIRIIGNYIEGFGRDPNNDPENDPLKDTDRGYACGIRIKGSTNVVCSENTIKTDENTKISSAIIVQERNGLAVNDCIIKDNYIFVDKCIDSQWAEGKDLAYLIRLDDVETSKNILITGNSLISKHRGVTGISLRRYSTNLLISNNNISTGDYYGIRAHNSMDALKKNVRIVNNTIEGRVQLAYCNGVYVYDNKITDDASDFAALQFINSNDGEYCRNQIYSAVKKYVSLDVCENIEDGKDNIFYDEDGRIDSEQQLNDLTECKIGMWTPFCAYTQNEKVIFFSNGCHRIYSCTEAHIADALNYPDIDGSPWEEDKDIHAGRALADKNGNNISETYATKKELEDAAIGKSNIIVDQSYNSESENAQSGIAVAEALLSKKVDVINQNSDDEHYPSALAVKTYADGLKPYIFDLYVDENFVVDGGQFTDTAMMHLLQAISQGRQVFAHIIHGDDRHLVRCDSTITTDLLEETFNFVRHNKNYKISVNETGVWKTEVFEYATKEDLEGLEEGGTSVVVDKTLTVEGAAADAKAVGDELAKVKEFFTVTAIISTDESGNMSIADASATFEEISEAYLLGKNIVTIGKFIHDDESTIFYLHMPLCQITQGIVVFSATNHMDETIATNHIGETIVATYYSDNTWKIEAKSTDYWTEENKAEIKSYVDEAILGGAW